MRRRGFLKALGGAVAGVLAGVRLWRSHPGRTVLKSAQPGFVSTITYFGETEYGRVMYVTKEGIYEISGGKTRKISSKLNGRRADYVIFDDVFVK